jgi:hypothetical protein
VDWFRARLQIAQKFVVLRKSRVQRAIMLRRLLPTLLAIVALSMVDASVAQADTINIINTDSGWYDSTGFHDPSIQNYVSGDIGDHFRNFFTFNLAAAAGETITSAQLRLYTWDITSAGTYTSYDVATPVSTLTAGGSGQLTTYADLGSGVSYGSIGLSAVQTNTFILINLNAAAVAAIQANANSVAATFAIGGDFLGGAGDYAYGFSQFSVENQLILKTQSTSTQSVPDSTSTLVLMLMVGLLGVVVKFSSGLKSA